jgi:transcription initiation factor TFIIA large subunit
LGAQGTVYHNIINEVINSSRIDFEEAGINVSTLEDLKQVSSRLIFVLSML